MGNFASNNKILLIALNPAIGTGCTGYFARGALSNCLLLCMIHEVLVRFGGESAWYLVALVANALCLWVLWFRETEPPAKLASVRATPRRSVTEGNTSPASSGSEVSREKLKPKRKSSTSRDRASSSSVDEPPQPKRATFLGQINGVKTFAGASLKMCATSPAEIVPGCWTQVDATRFNVRQGL
ncbi:unnamed protein product [Phytophthora lilii]|uniref:Unnamed protein product n=1 Tax=Phytophthora lilii TaxID=2077276 RepID=A0A9W6WPR1_9STRA|nr:unnamed protein product [Phytophthora lilii]